jgi:hypothetical protein
MHVRLKSIAAITVTAALGVGAVADAAGDAPTQVTVQPVASITAGATSPFDVPGVKAIRRGKAIPAGYVLIGRQITIKRGEVAAGASLFFRCPDGKRLKSFATTGRAGFSSHGSYVGHRQTYVDSFSSRDAVGNLYAVCR